MHTLLERLRGMGDEGTAMLIVSLLAFFGGIHALYNGVFDFGLLYAIFGAYMLGYFTAVFAYYRD